MSRINPIPLIAVGIIVMLVLATPFFGLPSPEKMDILHRVAPPSLAHPLGQDEYGRDELSRLLWGARTSLVVAAASSSIACMVGTLLGVAGGFLGGVAELFALRSMDVLLCFPPLLLALLVVSLLGPGVGTLVPVLGLVFLPGFVRVAYAGVLSVRRADYVEAVRVLGAGHLRIMLRTVLPNIGGPALVQFSLAAASAVMLESGLSFLGLGVVPPTPSWGLMIASARAIMQQAPLLLLWPCLALALTILAMNGVCDTLRDLVDPHLLPQRRGVRQLIGALLPRRLPESSAVLEVRGLTIELETPAGPVRPVRDVALHVAPGETIAVVGESGSGKSLTGLAIMGLLPPIARVAQGTAWVQDKDVLRLAESDLRRLRGRHMAIVFQDPLSSLNPVHRIGRQLAEAITAHRRLPAKALRRQVIELLRQVGIPDPQRRMDAFPHELSGGMRQRVVIAMALANDPQLLIADEPTTALDVTIQAQVLDLLDRLRRERRMGLLFITHSLPVVAEIADRVVVMYAGQVVEQGMTASVLARPLHPYTMALLRSAPREDGRLPASIPGVPPAPHALPTGCAFAPRCPHRRQACEAERPPLVTVNSDRSTRCFRWQELADGAPVQEVLV